MWCLNRHRGEALLKCLAPTQDRLSRQILRSCGSCFNYTGNLINRMLFRSESRRTKTPAVIGDPRLKISISGLPTIQQLSTGGSKKRPDTWHFRVSSSTERALRLLRSELQPLSVWKRKRRDWLRRLRPCGCWLVRHNSVRGRG